jgi:hypothetical protein
MPHFICISRFVCPFQGTISLEELHKYHCDSDRRLLCLFGTIFDVTSSEKGYGKDGACTFFEPSQAGGVRECAF